MVKQAQIQGTYLLRNVHVITGDGAELEGVDVLISQGRFARISQEHIDAPDAFVIEAKGKTLMPGLIDAHVHLDYLHTRGRFSAWYRTNTVLKSALRDVLEAGVTTIRCMADPLRLALQLRKWAEADPFRGPNMLVAGPALTAAGGHPAVTVAQDNPWLSGQIAYSIESPAQAVQVIRKLHEDGVDHIKIVYQGGMYGVDRIPLQQLSKEAMIAVVAEAHALGLRVSAHTHEEADVETLLRAGVDSIEHGVLEHGIAHEEMLKLWADSGARLVPTLLITSLISGPDGELYLKHARANLALAYASGVRIVAGTDSTVGAMPATSLHDELRYMVDAGMSEQDVVCAATSNAAELLGLSERGVIAEGKRADALLLRSNPLEQIENTTDIDLVFHNGLLMHETPPPPKQPELAMYAPNGPLLVEYIDRTETTFPHEVLMRYDRSNFASEGVRTLTYLDAGTKKVLRNERVVSGTDLVTREWECEIPGEGTVLHAVREGGNVVLKGTFNNEQVVRTFPLRGVMWMQWLQLDPATFAISKEAQVNVASIGTVGRGALTFKTFELTKRGSVDGGCIDIEMVIPKWRKFWGANVLFDALTGELVRQQIRGKEQKVLQRIG